MDQLKGHVPRITYATTVVLAALEHGLTHGFDIMDETGLPAGTVYPILRRLEEAGLLRSAWEAETRARAAGRPRRRNYRLTAAGRAAVKEALARHPRVLRLFDGPPYGAPEHP
jgi:DNA-binding PadR family transcriptional regulator